MKRNNRDAEEHRLTHPQHLIELFSAARGRGPSNARELEVFLCGEIAAGRLPPRTLGKGDGSWID